jgi:phosphoribosylglycinamide formyltransferase-1
MVALAKACSEGRVPAKVAVVIAPNGDIPAVQTAVAMGFMVAAVPPEPIETYGDRLLDILLKRRYDDKSRVGILAGAVAPIVPSKWICLAGYTRLLPKEVLAAYPNHVLNIHPAVLPQFGGKGMYGIRVHEAVLGSGDLESGCTVHFVNEQYDDGAIILQRRVPVLPDDTPETLAHRVLEQEHIAYAEALAKVIHESRS